MSMLEAALTMDHKAVIEDLIKRLHESNGAIKVLYRHESPVQIMNCNEILDKNTASITAAKKLIYK